MPDAPRTPTQAKRASGAQPGNSNALKHGGYRRRRALKEIDWTTQLDRRTSLYRELQERTARIVAGAGGPDAIDRNRLALAPYAAQVELELECLNQAIRDQGPIDRRRNTARRIVEDRNRLLRVYRETLDVIGWDRKATPVEPLAALLEEYRERRAARGQDERDAEEGADGHGEDATRPEGDDAPGSE